MPPPPHLGDPSAMLANFLLGRKPALAQIIDAQRKHAEVFTYQLELSDVDSPISGSAHGADLGLLFAPSRPGHRRWVWKHFYGGGGSDEEKYDAALYDLSERMIDCWTNFAKKGRPGGGKAGPAWTSCSDSFGSGGSKPMIFRTTLSTAPTRQETDPSLEELRVWEGIFGPSADSTEESAPLLYGGEEAELLRRVQSQGRGAAAGGADDVDEDEDIDLDGWDNPERICEFLVRLHLANTASTADPEDLDGGDRHDNTAEGKAAGGKAVRGKAAEASGGGGSGVVAAPVPVPFEFIDQLCDAFHMMYEFVTMWTDFDFFLPEDFEDADPAALRARGTLFGVACMRLTGHNHLYRGALRDPVDYDWLIGPTERFLFPPPLHQLQPSEQLLLPEARRHRPRLRVLTWNVWFESFAFRRRNEVIMRTLDGFVAGSGAGAGGSIDVMCFQEVTRSFLRMLKQRPWIRTDKHPDGEFVISDPLGKTFGLRKKGGRIRPGYGTVVVARAALLPRFECFTVKSSSEQQRKLMTAELWVNGEKLLVGTVHLESRDQHTTRTVQLMSAAAVFDEFHGELDEGYALCGAAPPSRRGVATSSILAGDFNFSDHNYHPGRLQVENDTLGEVLPNHVDVWRALKPVDDPGTTHGTVYVDFYRSSGRAKRQPEPEQEVVPRRYDRVLARLSPSWKAVDIAIVGDTPIPRRRRRHRHHRLGEQKEAAAATGSLPPPPSRSSSSSSSSSSTDSSQLAKSRASVADACGEEEGKAAAPAPAALASVAAAAVGGGPTAGGEGSAESKGGGGGGTSNDGEAAMRRKDGGGDDDDDDEEERLETPSDHFALITTFEWQRVAGGKETG